ncbi:MAG: P1 family peptidase [Lactimicrobium sp.]|jgi:D-aminopeptidase|uniref:P1 family peptidase n=1 Tax=Lactimicrobium sp. TaxID=2563780 RepID=UPI002F35E568
MKARDLTDSFYPSGKRNLITDVPGVLVGHYTCAEENHHTGITVILPQREDVFPSVFESKYIAACHVQNGFGKSMGLVQIDELGTLETPIVLTNTLDVGKMADGLVEHMIALEKKRGVTVSSINPVVGECNDSLCNVIQDRILGEKQLEAAFSSASETFELGAVGAGSGTVCFGLKGGIGSASWLVTLKKQTYTFGLLVQANFGRTRCLRVHGSNVGAEIAERIAETKDDKGSIMMILACDCPLSSRQLKRVLRRGPNGLARLGGYTGNGSGEVVIGFTTAGRVKPVDKLQSFSVYPDQMLDPVFEAVSEMCEEAVLSALLCAKSCTGINGTVYHSLSEFMK